MLGGDLGDVVMPKTNVMSDHQQYLHKNPYGYRCHANTGVPFPSTD